MGSELLSSGERAFIVEGAAANVRSDGRSRLDYREFSLQTSVIPKVGVSRPIQLARLYGVERPDAKWSSVRGVAQANGSARLRLFDSPCDVTASPSSPSHRCVCARARARGNLQQNAFHHTR